MVPIASRDRMFWAWVVAVVSCSYIAAYRSDVRISICVCVVMVESCGHIAAYPIDVKILSIFACFLVSSQGVCK